MFLESTVKLNKEKNVFCFLQVSDKFLDITDCPRLCNIDIDRKRRSC